MKLMTENEPSGEDAQTPRLNADEGVRAPLRQCCFGAAKFPGERCTKPGVWVSTFHGHRVEGWSGEFLLCWCEDHPPYAPGGKRTDGHDLERLEEKA